MENTSFQTMLDQFCKHLVLEEYAPSSISYYRRDLRALKRFLEGEGVPLCKESLIAYKKTLEERLQPSSVNRSIAAINCFLRFLKRDDLCLKSLKIQEANYSDKELTKREFDILVRKAMESNVRIGMIILTLAGTGMRISELKYITVQAVKKGKAVIKNKGKFRIVILPSTLQKTLLDYCAECTITSGMVFTSRQGKALSRSYISLEVKKIAARCGVDPEKVFLHNFRHFFARRFLECGYPVTDLADHLGHTNINTTRRYLVTSTETRQKQLSKLAVFNYSTAKSK